MKIKKINIVVISIAFIWTIGLFPGARPAEAKEYKWKPLTSSHRAYQAREERAVQANNEYVRTQCRHNDNLEFQKQYLKELKQSSSRERRTMP